MLSTYRSSSFRIQAEKLSDINSNSYFFDYTSMFLSFFIHIRSFISQDNLKRSVFSSLLIDGEVTIKMYLNCCN